MNYRCLCIICIVFLSSSNQCIDRPFLTSCYHYRAWPCILLELRQIECWYLQGVDCHPEHSCFPSSQLVNHISLFSDARIQGRLFECDVLHSSLQDLSTSCQNRQYLFRTFLMDLHPTVEGHRIVDSLFSHALTRAPLKNATFGTEALV